MRFPRARCGPYGRLIASDGLIRPVALARGRAVGTWTQAGGKVALKPFAPLSAPDAAALADDAADLEHFLTSAQQVRA